MSLGAMRTNGMTLGRMPLYTWITLVVQCMILVALRTGLRLGELLALRREDRDLVSGVLHVRQSVTRGIITEPKSGKGRDVPLSNDALAALKEQQHLRGPLVFL